MDQSKQVQEIYNKSAGIYDISMLLFGYTKSAERIISVLIEKMNFEPKRILDVGCGTGNTTRTIRKKFPNADIVGLDYSEKMLTYYNKRYPDFGTIYLNLNDKEARKRLITERVLKTESFDLIISAGTLSEYTNIGETISYLYNLLAKNGALINIGVKDHPLNRISQKKFKYKPIKKREITETCRKIGFRKVFSPKITHPLDRALRYGIITIK